MDQGLFTAADAKKAGLIDEVLYADQFADDDLEKKLGAENVDIVSNYKKKTDRHRLLRHLGGMMKLMEMLMGGKPRRKPGTKPKIAVVYAVGPIIEGKSGSDMFGECLDRLDHDRRRPAQSGRRRPRSWRSCCGSTAPAARPRPAT